jgi:glycosyltransferase involved in cell wall biosynthesis
MTRRIYYDGSNLSLEQGTGILTYTRMLTQIAQDLGNEIGVIYSSRQKPAKNGTMREIAFFDSKNAIKVSRTTAFLGGISDQIRCHFPVRPVPVDFSGFVVSRQFTNNLPAYDNVFVSRELFDNARSYFERTKKFVELSFDEQPDILHCTYQLPLRAKSACNIYTIHDLVPLRLPFASLDNKRQSFRLLKKIAAEADHIVTVSEHSKRDIVKLLGVDEKRVTNTYQAVAFPQAYVDRPDAEIAEQLEGSFGLEFGNYLLFYSALEPKKNVARLIEAYLASGVDIPLVLVASGGWENDIEINLLKMLETKERSANGREGRPPKRHIYRFDYMSIEMLVTVVRGARALLFPSLYEGFGLPVLEAMLLGTPVITSTESSLPEIAGDAAIFVDPYQISDIANAIKTIVSDQDLRAELSRRGRQQAAKFSVDRYRERIEALYSNL